MYTITKHILYSVLCLGVIFILLEQIPIKRAVVIDDISSFQGIICRRAHCTGPPWELIRDRRGIYNKTKLVILEGKTPEELVDTFFVDANNHFILKGEIVEKKEHKYGEPSRKYEVICLEDWDIVYPIDRGNSLRIFASKKYLSIFDFRWFKTYERVDR